MERGLRLTIIWFDDDVVELRVAAGNGSFAGVADCYCEPAWSARVADAVRGFPRVLNDRREFVLGTFEPGCAGGGARVVLTTDGSRGRGQVRIELQDRSKRTDRDANATAAFGLDVEPAAIDDFVAALDGMRLAVGSRATLRHAE